MNRLPCCWSGIVVMMPILATDCHAVGLIFMNRQTVILLALYD